MPKFVDFKAIKAAVTMEQVLQRYGLLDTFKRAQSGNSLSGPCPIHRGSNPTQFRVSLSKNCWNSFSDCKCGGNVLDFVAKKEDISVHAAALQLAEWFNLSLTEPPPEEEHESPRAAMPAKATSPKMPLPSTPPAALL